MTPEEVVNKLLWHSCPAFATNDKDTQVYMIESHCTTWAITATLVNTLAPHGAYEVVSMEVVND